MRARTKRSRWATVAALTVALGLISCASDDGPGGSDAGADRGAGDAVATPDSGPGDPDGALDPDGATGPDGAVTPDGSEPSAISNPFGFAMRAPAERTVACPDAPEYMPSELQQLDMDWLCTFEHEGVFGQIYVQADAVGCASVGMSMAPVFAVKGAFIAAGGKVSALSGASYDWGGNHNNDELAFSHDGKHYRYYHSSFGFGWRKCQPMDCMQRLAAPGGDVLQDGCTAERTLPVICLQVDGSKSAYAAADLAQDPFAVCPGDPNL